MRTSSIIVPFLRTYFVLTNLAIFGDKYLLIRKVQGGTDCVELTMNGLENRKDDSQENRVIRPACVLKYEHNLICMH